MEGWVPKKRIFEDNWSRILSKLFLLLKNSVKAWKGSANTLHPEHLKCCDISGQLATCHTLCILKVVSPQGPNLILTTNVPHSEADVLVFDRFHIEAYTVTDKTTCANA